MRLEHRRLGVGPEDPLQRLDDLTLRAVCTRAVEQRFDQVAIAGGRLAQRVEGPLRLLGVAGAAHGLGAADLLALELGRYSQDLELLLALVLVAIDADN